MNGFSVEPGERTVLVMSIQPERLASKKSAEPTSPRISPVWASASTMATDSLGPSFLAASRATVSSPSWTRLADGELVDLPPDGAFFSAALAACGARAGRRRRTAANSSAAARSASLLVDQAGVPCGRARGRARHARRRGCGRACRPFVLLDDSPESTGTTGRVTTGGHAYDWRWRHDRRQRCGDEHVVGAEGRARRVGNDRAEVPRGVRRQAGDARGEGRSRRAGPDGRLRRRQSV